jgi:predicted GIY-YIG superfamily endonuclease
MDIEGATSREKQFKKWLMWWKINLIEKKNPKWDYL